MESDADQQPTSRTCLALRDSLNSSDFTHVFRAKDSQNAANKAKHHRYETQIQMIKEENFERGDFNSSALANSETKKDQNVGLVKNINDLVENYSNSNQSSVARFGFQSSHIRTKTLVKNSQPGDTGKAAGSSATAGGFDISQRSTMMQGVIGPNHQVDLLEEEQRGSKSSGGEDLDINELGLNKSRFKAATSDHIESDQEMLTHGRALASKAKVKQNLQKLLSEEDQTEEAYSTQPGMTGPDGMDLMINKQSFSVNPRELKKGSSNNTGSEPAGNFMQILSQYTQEQDMKQNHYATTNHLVQENEALSKENEQLKQQLADKEKALADQGSLLKYE